ncbi:hypothetical protein EYF80_020751 [Liparis tanakae]|uniref:Uncharacterized protein n=1 Tax=Liparis tanakae TaxID=230148 RepID=A0A4Z2HTG4_9TELE|nr:hypothetical protein EYF80_020751 [Liparis tanakae]
MSEPRESRVRLTPVALEADQTGDEGGRCQQAWRRGLPLSAISNKARINGIHHKWAVICCDNETDGRQQQQCSSCYYSSASATQKHAEPCSSHTNTSSTEQPCSSLQQHSSFHSGLCNPSTGDNAPCCSITKPCAHYTFEETLIRSYGISTEQTDHILKEDNVTVVVHSLGSHKPHFQTQQAAVFSSNKIQPLINPTLHWQTAATANEEEQLRSVCSVAALCGGQRCCTLLWEKERGAAGPKTDMLPLPLVGAVPPAPDRRDPPCNLNGEPILHSGCSTPKAT